MVSKAILILWIGVVAADLPEEWVELVVKAILTHVPKNLNLLDVSLEVSPNIVVNWDNNLGLKSLSHAEHIGCFHLVLNTNWVAAKSTKADVYAAKLLSDVFAVLSKVNGVVRVTGVIDVSTRGDKEVVNCLLIHVHWALTPEVRTVLRSISSGNDDGAVKGIVCNNLHVLDLDAVARLNNNALLAWNAPANPNVNCILRTNKGNRNLFAILVSSGHVVVNNVSRKLLGHVVLVNVSYHNSVKVLDSKGINNKGDVAQVWLHLTNASHVCHLVTRLHEAVTVGALTIACPEVDSNVCSTRSLKPNTNAAEPPHLNLAWLYYGIVNLFVEPSSPLREGAHNPTVACDVFQTCHYALLSKT